MHLDRIRKYTVISRWQQKARRLVPLLAMLQGACAIEPDSYEPPSADIDVILTPLEAFDVGFSEPGSGDGRRQVGHAAAVAARGGAIYVVDSSVPGLVRLDDVSREIRLLLELGDGNTNGLYVTADLIVYVVDRENRSVIELSESGWHRRVYEDEHRIPSPADVTETNWGATVLVADELTRRLVLFDNLSNPTGMLAPTLSPVAIAASINAVAATDNFVFVLDTTSREVTQIDLRGMPVGTFGEDALLVPVAMAVDECLRIFVADGHADGLFVSSPEYLGAGSRAALPVEIVRSVTDLWIDGNTLYVAAGPFGVHVLNVDPPCLGDL